MEVRVFSTAPVKARRLAGRVGIAAGAVLSLALADGRSASAQTPSSTSETVTVTGRRPIVVTGTDWCPKFDSGRRKAEGRPQVVDSFPAQGGTVAPGAVMVRVTFDAPMSCYSEVTVEGGDDAIDPCQPAGTWVLPDRRSWLMACRFEPRTSYRLRFAKADGAGFIGLSGREAAPFVLTFSTRSGRATATLAEAVQADRGMEPAADVRAYVTCVDERDSTLAQGCRHVRLPRPPS